MQVYSEIKVKNKGLFLLLVAALNATVHVIKTRLYICVYARFYFRFKASMAVIWVTVIVYWTWNLFHVHWSLNFAILSYTILEFNLNFRLWLRLRFGLGFRLSLNFKFRFRFFNRYWLLQVWTQFLIDCQTKVIICRLLFHIYFFLSFNHISRNFLTKCICILNNLQFEMVWFILFDNLT